MVSIKSLFYDVIWWSLFIYAMILLIPAYQTLEGWKYGYWSLDFIPPIIIFALLWMISQFVSINRLERFCRTRGMEW